MNEVKALNKKIEEFCKSKNLALIRHYNRHSINSTLAISFKRFLLNEWQQNSDGSDKIIAEYKSECVWKFWQWS